MFEIPFNASCSTVKQYGPILNGACPFVDTWSTRFAIVEWFVYTPQTDTFHSLKFYCEVLAGGFWLPEYWLTSFQIWTEKRMGETIYEFVFLAFVIYYWVMFFYELVIWIKHDKGALAFIFEFWNLLEITNLCTFMAVFILRWIWMTTSKSNASHLKLPFASTYPPTLDRLMMLYTSQVYANSFNTILTFLKLLKYVRLNPRLNVLTMTISTCQQSIVGVLVLFVFIIVGYGITGWTLYGINIQGYRNLGVSMSTLLRMLVGDMDYEAMRNENRFLTPVFFWSFVILALFLLLNFLIAIISEAFAKISGKAFAQSFDEIFLRYVQWVRAYFTPSNLKRIIVGKLTGHSESKYLKMALESLKKALEDEKQKLVTAQSLRFANETGDEDEEVVVFMMRSDWKVWLDAEVYERLGDHFFDYFWDEMMNDYDDAQKASEEVDKRQMLETVKDGVQKVVGEDIQEVRLLDQMLTALETEVSKILNAASNEAT